MYRSLQRIEYLFSSQEVFGEAICVSASLMRHSTQRLHLLPDKACSISGQRHSSGTARLCCDDFNFGHDQTASVLTP
jgi:hypothetical protein